MEVSNSDLSSFLNQYTAQSNPIKSPTNARRESDIFIQNISSEEHLLEVTEDEPFCTPHNLDQRLLYLNQELSLLGYVSIFSNNNLTIKNNARLNLDVSRLVCCTYELLKRQHSQIKLRNDLEEKQMRSENDNEYLMQNQVRLKQDLENLKRECALIMVREKEQTKKCKSLQQDVKIEREEKRKMKSDVDHLKKQYSHELKRMEKETIRLQNKVHQLLNDKTQDKSVLFGLSNCLQRNDGKRSTWKNSGGKRHEEEMYKLVISNYEEKEKILLAENECIRELLLKTQNLLTTVDSSLLCSENEEENKRQMQMPFPLIQDDMEKRFESLVESIRLIVDVRSNVQQASLSTDGGSFSNSNVNEEFQEKLEQYKEIIVGQERLINGMRDGQTKEALEAVLMNFDVNIADLVEIKQREKKLTERTKSFNDEQRQFTDYVLKVEKEKEEFEKERVDFYMKCLSTPVVNKHIHGNKGHQHESIPSTNATCCSPKSTYKTKTPSTAELYKYMSLSSEDREIFDRHASHDGSFVTNDMSPEDSPSSKKLIEHTKNIRKAVEEKHKSLELEHTGKS